MSVQFTIRSSDIQRLEWALQDHRCVDEHQQWIVQLAVSPAVAEFRFGSRVEQYPINGKAPGFAKFPRDLVHQIFDNPDRQEFPKEVSVEMSEGILEFDGSRIKGDIEVGSFRDSATYGAVVYLRDAELAALETLPVDALPWPRFSSPISRKPRKELQNELASPPTCSSPVASPTKKWRNSSNRESQRLRQV